MICYIGIGSNQGRREENLRLAVQGLSRTRGVCVRKVSPVYETQPQGGPSGQRDYLNLAVEVQTRWGPRRLLKRLKAIEKDMGRDLKAPRWSARPIDLDILLCGRTVIKEKDLEVPHPLMHRRFFVLRPLADLSVRLRHPVLGRDIGHLLMQVKKRGRWKKIEKIVS
jgi:2-amino-4-hydroxy-6-hydroxymethyldihydropteridine diphosphokinase